MLRSMARVGVLVMGASVAWAAEANVWLNVPFVKQQRDGCGAAAIAMVMQYWQEQDHQENGAGSDPEQILRELYSKSAHGIYARAMTGYFEGHGYQAFAFAGQWPDLERALAKGRPLIAAVKPGPGGELHYVVVAGLDEPDHLVLLNDPARRKLAKQDAATFERQWKATGNWTLLAVPREPAR